MSAKNTPLFIASGVYFALESTLLQRPRELHYLNAGYAMHGARVLAHTAKSTSNSKPGITRTRSVFAWI